MYAQIALFTILRFGALVFFILNTASAQSLKFTEVSQSVGIDYTHDYQIEITPVAYRVTAGFAVGDYDNDGYPDIYVETGDVGNNLLFKNRGDGSFLEKGEEMGVHLPNFLGACPFFVDYDNDGFQDLLIGGLSGEITRVFHNKGGLEFVEITAQSGLACDVSTYSFSAGDYDKDGLLDLFLTHWGVDNAQNHIWKNLGNGTFVNVDEDLGFFNPFGDIDYTFAGSFTDFNDDGWSDLLISSDFETSQIWMNEKGQYFRHITDTDVINDENGMGSAIGDYNNDGLLDWFVTAVYDSDGVTEGNWGDSGNRLYKNMGANQFEEVAVESGVSNGSWGWGASFGDLNNDGFLDIVHNNGWPRGSDQFYEDSTRIFVSNKDGTFKETAIACEMKDTGQGRGISLLDYDRDGDLDIFSANLNDRPALWRNDLSLNNNYISINLSPLKGETAIGSKVFLYANSQQQFRELRAGTNYNSQNPLDLHFGLGMANIIDSLIVHWPDGRVHRQFNVSPNQFLTIHQDLTPVFQEKSTLFPNPFDQWFKIHCTCERGMKMTLRILDVNGHLLSEGLSYSEKDGFCYFEWNAANEKINLTAGVYLIQILENDHVKIIRKIVKQ